MAKRTRGTTSRPGQRAPLARPSTSRRPGPGSPTAHPTDDRPGDAGSTPRSGSLTVEEEARAAELEARIVEAERAADQAATRSRREAREAAEPRTRTGSIQARAADEYAYVLRDVRRIVLIGGSLFAALIGLWVVTQATGVTPSF